MFPEKCWLSKVVSANEYYSWYNLSVVVENLLHPE